MGRRGNSDNDGKYLRLTGLWPSKKNNALWTGKFRNQDIGALQDKIQEADDAGADLVVFLWENTDRKGKKDPEFTVQISVSEDQGNSRGSNRGRSSGNSGSRRSSRNDRDNEETDTNDDQDDQDNEEENNEKEERSTRGRKSSKNEEPKGRSKNRSASNSGKRDKNDW